MAQTWHIGDRPRINMTFTNDSGALVDPDTLTLKIKRPDDVITTLVYGIDAAIVRITTGTYYYLLELTQSNNWFYRVEGTGTRLVANEGTIYVQPSHF